METSGTEQDGLLLKNAPNYGSGDGVRQRAGTESSRPRGSTLSRLTQTYTRGYSNSVTGKSVPTLASLSAADDDADSEDTGPTTMCEDVMSLLRLAVPYTAGSMVYSIGGVVSTIYLGHISTSALAAAGLSMTWMGLTSVAAGGMSTGIIVLSSQAHGQAEEGGDPNLASLVFLRGLSLTVILTAITGVSWCFTYYYAKLIGATEEVALLANQYSLVMLAGLPATTWCSCLVQFLCAQDIAFPTMVASTASIPVSIGCGYLFIFVFGWGFIGAPLASVASVWVAMVAMTGYHIYSHEDGLSHITRGWTTDMSILFGWQAVKSYCSIALPNLAGIVMEEVAFDAIVVMATMCSTNVLAATNVIITIYGFWYGVGACISDTLSSRVGAAIGRDDVPKAQRESVAGAIVTAIPQSMFVVVMIFAGTPVCSVFTTDPVVAKLANAGLAISVIGNSIDAVVSCLAMGVLMGMGSAEVIAYSKAAMLVAVIPAAYYLGVYSPTTDAGHVIGLWWGWLVGICACLIVAMYYVITADWQKAVEVTRERLAADQEDEEMGGTAKQEAGTLAEAE